MYNYIYGPVPSRRLGLSLGISPIIRKKCNYSCIYCQLGRTKHITNSRKEFVPLQEIVSELKDYISSLPTFDVLTIVGEGEPLLYSKLGKLLQEIKKLSPKPVAVITNGSLLFQEEIPNELMYADIVLPSLDAYDELTYRKINRPIGSLSFNKVYSGLVNFSKKYTGQLWLELMLINGINDDIDSLYQFKKLLKEIRYSRLYINTPIRPPAEKWVAASSEKHLKNACDILQGTSIDRLASESFHSEITDTYDAVMSIIHRHPMNQHELKTFISTRKNQTYQQIIDRLNIDNSVEKISYQGYLTYRIKKYN